MINPITPGESFKSRVTGLQNFCKGKLMYGTPRLGLGVITFSNPSLFPPTLKLHDTLAHSMIPLLAREREQSLRDYLQLQPIIFYGTSGNIHAYQVPPSLDISPIFTIDFDNTNTTTK
jgi:hypothetical protein